MAFGEPNQHPPQAEDPVAKTEAERLKRMARWAEIGEQTQRMIAELKSTYPNLARITSDGRNLSPETILEMMRGLLALIDLFDLQTRVFALEIHGSAPCLLFIRDSDLSDQEGSYQLGKIYEFSGDPPSYQTEGWDPQPFGFPVKVDENGQPRRDASGCYFLAV